MDKESILKKAQGETKENNDNDYITYIDRKAKRLSSGVIYALLSCMFIFPYVLGVNDKIMIPILGIRIPFDIFCFSLCMVMAGVENGYRFYFLRSKWSLVKALSCIILIVVTVGVAIYRYG